MQIKTLKTAALMLAAPAIAMAVPANAASPSHFAHMAVASQYAPGHGHTTAAHHKRKHRGWNNGRGNPHRYQSSTYRYDRGYRTYEQPVYRDTRIWRGDDGRYYCRKEDGTTGLLIGAAVGGLAGRELAGRGDRTLGAIIGAAGGAILGRAIDRSNSRCR